MHNNVEIYSKFNGTAVLTAAGVLSFYNNLESNGEQARPDSRERLSPPWTRADDFLFSPQPLLLEVSDRCRSWNERSARRRVLQKLLLNGSSVSPAILRA